MAALVETRLFRRPSERDHVGRFLVFRRLLTPEQWIDAKFVHALTSALSQLNVRVEGSGFSGFLGASTDDQPEILAVTEHYAGLLDALQDPKHPEHADMTEWIEDGFDPEAFDLEAINEALRRFK